MIVRRYFRVNQEANVGTSPFHGSQGFIHTLPLARGSVCLRDLWVWMVEQECCTPSVWLSVSLSSSPTPKEYVHKQYDELQCNSLFCHYWYAGQSLFTHAEQTEGTWLKKFRLYDFGICKYPFRPILSWLQLCPKHMYNSLGFILRLQLLSNLSGFILGQYIRSNDVLCIRLKQDKWYLVII